MKSILTFIIGFAFIGINAQQVIYSKKNLPMQENIQTHHNEIRNIFSELNTNNIPTSILVDAAIEFAD